eukprot:1220326-Prymnesium_polylepis.1
MARQCRVETCEYGTRDRRTRFPPQTQPHHAAHAIESLPTTNYPRKALNAVFGGVRCVLNPPPCCWASAPKPPPEAATAPNPPPAGEPPKAVGAL